MKTLKKGSFILPFSTVVRMASIVTLGIIIVIIILLLSV